MKNYMTVDDVINELKKYDKDMMVITPCSSDYYHSLLFESKDLEIEERYVIINDETGQYSISNGITNMKAVVIG